MASGLEVAHTATDH